MEMERTLYIEMNDPRKSTIEYMRSTVSTRMWSDNVCFVGQLRGRIAKHPLNFHGIIHKLNNGLVSKKDLVTIHLEYRHAIVQIFTDALLVAQHLSKQLEPRLCAGSKMHARFLITLNILDEFGYQPGLNSNRYYKGNSKLSHYVLFESLLDDFKISQQKRINYQPTNVAKNIRNYLESSYDDFAMVCALLAVAEEQVILFSPALRNNTQAVGLNVDNGYYFVHGISSDDSVNAYDDDHENDLWTILNQALTPDKYSNIEGACLQFCDLWDLFWSKQLMLVTNNDKKHNISDVKKM